MKLLMKWFPSLLVAACSGMAAAVASGNETGRSSVFDSIPRGDRVALRTILSYARLISSRDHQGNTLLICAAAYADVRTVRLLLEKGADPNATNNAGVTALMRAAGEYDKVRLLLNRGADPNKKSALGNTALLLA